MLCLAAPLPRLQIQYTVPGIESFDPAAKFRSVGVFGSFGKDTKLQERDNFGLLAFGAREDNSIFYGALDDGKDLTIGRAVFPGPVTDKKFEVLDWTTGRLSFKSGGAETEAFFSRAFPALLYRTAVTDWEWQGSFDHLAYRSGGSIKTAKPGDSIGSLDSPWLVAWSTSAQNHEVIPVLIRFEKGPNRLTFQDSIQATFAGPAGHVAVMPLLGIRRGGVADWQSLPGDQVEEADFWSRALMRFPIEADETYKVDERRHSVTIRDRYRYESFQDDWHTDPLNLAPAPPITDVAEQNGYPVVWNTAGVKRSPLSTFWGPFAYREGEELAYTIPIPSARDTMLAPVAVSNDPAKTSLEQELDKLAASFTVKPDDYSDGGLGLPLKEFSQSFRLLSPATQQQLAPQMAKAIDASLSDPADLQTVTDPVFNQRYVMCSKIWCSSEPYDREWYAGRQLDADYEYCAWVDRSAAERHWKAIQGLYAYFRIYNDWAWSGTLSSIYAYALCGDGMNFAMEGMLGAARMARMTGDTELWNDATYRSSKEALNTFASFFLTKYMADLDYVTWTDTSYDYQTKKGRYQVKRMAPADAQTGFGLDIFSDTTGIKVFRNGSFWHATAAIYWNNPAEDRLYAETLYPVIYKWEYQTMPELHPDWFKKESIERFTDQPYGNNLTVAHLDARTNLFHDSDKDIEPYLGDLQDNIAPLYRLRTAQNLVEAGGPQVWAPTADAEVTGCDWDAAAKRLTVTLRAEHSTRTFLDWNDAGALPVSPSPTPGPKPKSVHADDNAVAPKAIPGGLWRVPITIEAGQPLTVTIQY